jgi:hypothetical protein
MLFSIFRCEERGQPSGILTKRHFLICIKSGGEVPTYFRNQEKSPFETGMNIMPSGTRHWLEYDFVAVVVLFVSIGFLALIVLSI